jgi:ABC-type multidrug transport system ATPase subunit
MTLFLFFLLFSPIQCQSVSLDGEWSGNLPLVNFPFTATFRGQTAEIRVPRLSLMNMAAFEIDTSVTPHVVQVRDTNCLLQPTPGSLLRAIWSLSSDGRQLTIAVRTADCATKLPTSFEAADGVLTIVARRRSGEPTPEPPTPKPTPARATPPPMPLFCPRDNFTEIETFRYYVTEERMSRVLEKCRCTDGRIGPECRVCTRDADCRVDNRTACETRFDRVRDAGNWFCSIVSDPAIEQYFSLNRSRLTVAFANGSADVTLWDSTNGLPRTFQCRATGCRASAAVSNTVTCDATLCWCERGAGCNPALLELLKGPTTTASFQCDADGLCSFRQRELPFFLSVKCRFGNCYSEAEERMRAHVAGPPRNSLPMLWAYSGAAWAIVALALACCLALLLASRPKIDVAADLRGDDTEPQQPGVQLRFESIFYGVGDRLLLRGISGHVAPGELLAIIGASGAGKTTLLDLLAGWRKSGEARGTILVDGEPRDSASFKRISGYVPQEEPFQPSLTVVEQLEITAALTFDAAVGPVARRRRVDQALADVGLSHVRHTRIGQVVAGGGGARGISGGERRRLSIANQLLARPRILFCDEPTSGLDAANALLVLDVLHRLARDRKQTIVLSIHQPRHDIFAMFNRLLLLQDGQAVYFGPAAMAAEHFAQLGAVCPAGVNFADFALDTLAAAKPEQRARFRAASHRLATADAALAQHTDERRRKHRQHSSTRRRHHHHRHSSRHHRRHRNDDDDGDDLRPSKVAADDDMAAAQRQPVLRGDGSYLASSFKRSEYSVSFLTQFTTLSYRSVLHTIRTWRLLATHALVAVLLALLVGAIYWKRGTGLAGFQDRLGSIFFSLALFAFANLSALDLFVTERDLFVREREASRYSPLAYYLSKAAVDIPLIRILPPVIYGLIVYTMIGYREGAIHMAIYIVALVLNSAASAALLYAVGAAVPSVAVGNVIGALLLLFFMLFGGFLLNNESAPDYVIWLQSVSFFNHAFEAAASNELAGAVFQFDPVGFFSVDVDGQAYLDQLGFSPLMLDTNLAALAGMTAAYLLLGYALLHFVVKSVR